MKALFRKASFGRSTTRGPDASEEHRQRPSAPAAAAASASATGGTLSLKTAAPSNPPLSLPSNLTPPPFEDEAMALDKALTVPVLMGAEKSLGVGLNTDNIVTSVAEGSAGAKAGLRLGDIVLGWQGRPLEGKRLQDVLRPAPVHILSIARVSALHGSEREARAEEGGATPRFVPSSSPRANPRPDACGGGCTGGSAEPSRGLGGRFHEPGEEGGLRGQSLVERYTTGDAACRGSSPSAAISSAPAAPQAAFLAAAAGSGGGAAGNRSSGAKGGGGVPGSKGGGSMPSWRAAWGTSEWDEEVSEGPTASGRGGANGRAAASSKEGRAAAAAAARAAAHDDYYDDDYEEEEEEAAAEAAAMRQAGGGRGTLSAAALAQARRSMGAVYDGGESSRRAVEAHQSHAAKEAERRMGRHGSVWAGEGSDEEGLHLWAGGYEEGGEEGADEDDESTAMAMFGAAGAGHDIGVGGGPDSEDEERLAAEAEEEARKKDLLERLAMQQAAVAEARRQPVPAAGIMPGYAAIADHHESRRQTGETTSAMLRRQREAEADKIQKDAEERAKANAPLNAFSPSAHKAPDVSAVRRRAQQQQSPPQQQYDDDDDDPRRRRQQQQREQQQREQQREQQEQRRRQPPSAGAAEDDGSDAASAQRYDVYAGLTGHGEGLGLEDDDEDEEDDAAQAEEHARALAMAREWAGTKSAMRAHASKPPAPADQKAPPKLTRADEAEAPGGSQPSPPPRPPPLPPMLSSKQLQSGCASGSHRMQAPGEASGSHLHSPSDVHGGERPPAWLGADDSPPSDRPPTTARERAFPKLGREIGRETPSAAASAVPASARSPPPPAAAASADAAAAASAAASADAPPTLARSMSLSDVSTLARDVSVVKAEYEQLLGQLQRRMGRALTEAEARQDQVPSAQKCPTVPSAKKCPLPKSAQQCPEVAGWLHVAAPCSPTLTAAPDRRA